MAKARDDTAAQVNRIVLTFVGTAHERSGYMPNMSGQNSKRARQRQARLGARQREQRAARQRRWRQRQRDGVIAVIVEIDGTGIDWLVRKARCLAETHAGDPREVGAAITRAIAVSSQS